MSYKIYQLAVDRDTSVEITIANYNSSNLDLEMSKLMLSLHLDLFILDVPGSHL